MRKYQQKQILNMIRTLDEVNAEVKRLFSLGNYEAVLTLLSDAHEFADHIIGFIGEVKSPNTQVAASLEQLMDIIKAAFEEIDKCIEDGSKPGEGFIKTWHRLYMKIESGVKNELKPDTLEMVFLPYKASMWDSFESVWLAARDDPKCDVYVVPIPYYDVLPDGSLGSEHWEGADYPDYVTVTDWKEYDIEARRPDVIFIHNPYDDINFITRVHRDFFSSRLKELTDMLVYIPYFVTLGEINEDFCLTPGSLNADKVFVESDTARRRYIQTVREYTKTPAERNKNPEEKFIASGSPKLDKVMNSKPEDFKMPEEWDKLLKKPDGSPKKVILYNVHLFMNTTDSVETQLDKMEYALKVFKLQSGITVLLRPHPLNLSFLRLRELQLIEKYKTIINDFKTSGWGIYDDSSDPHRAIAVSAAYYGDSSSLITMFQYAGKPVIIQNVSVQSQESSTINLRPACLIEAEGYYWFTPYKYNALFRMDKEALEVEYMGKFPGEALKGSRLYHSAARSGDKLYFTPQSAKNMAVYDLITGEFESVILPEPKETMRLKEYNEKAKLNRAIEAEGKLYLLPGSYPGLLIYDMKERRFELVDDFIKTLEKSSSNLRMTYINNALVDNKRRVLIMTSPHVNAVIEMDIETNKTAIHELKSEGKGYNCMINTLGAYWFVNKRGCSLTRFDPEARESTEYSAELENIETKLRGNFQKIQQFGDYLYLTPSAGNRPRKFNLKNNEFSDIEGFEPEEQGYSLLPAVLEDRMVMCPVESDVFIEYDPATKTKREKCLNMTEVRNKNSFYSHFFSENNKIIDSFKRCIIRENNGNLTLEMILDSIEMPQMPEWLAERLDLQSDLIGRELANADGTAGRAIYERCVKETLDI